MIQIKKKPPMPWFQKLFYSLSLIFLIAAFAYLGTKNYNAPIKKLTDPESFTKEYGITVNNVFTYKTGKEVLELLNTGSGIVFFAFPENEWSHAYADLLNETVKKFDIQEVWYYNFKNDRANNNHYYKNIVGQLNAYLPVLDNGLSNIYAPTVLFIRDGVVVGYDNETAIIEGNTTVSEYWTESKKQIAAVTLGVKIKNYLGEQS